MAGFSNGVKMRILLTLFIIFGCLTVAIVALVWSGFYNVAATVPHWRVTHWFLGEVRDRSISAHSKGITVPSLRDPKLFDIGFKNYHEMCRLCHGAPGSPRTEIAKGLNPEPPDFSSRDIKMRNEAELYWIIENGIKMTGMPAFGPTHSEDQLWGIVTLLGRLPKLKPEEYKTMVKALGLGDTPTDHGHMK
jgi:mono/diheme cytochrome c family protein